MKAVNLIPADERRSGGAGVLNDLSGPTLGLLGALVIALVVVVAFVTVSNGVAERRDDLTRIETNAAAAEQRAAALKPYGDVAALRDRTVASIRTLAAQRFDWPALLGELSRRVPADVTLTAMNGSAGATGAAATTGAGAPSVQLSGCTSDHAAVARLMERLRAVRGVADVTLATSTKGSAKADQSSGCPRRDQFDLALMLGTAAPVAVGATAPTTTTEAAAR
jgi:Tfp pilus assembly protein PilN